ncbi:hypothetical protein AC579_7555 [Pseudocercospora musae]|uniref:Uncharacterized protein n=1 Tax=Pseudocercospora musae TaxID=113226 RepID=A0A139IHP1_9PEZI|nr:hypothetical protein AC579_7555 [Pseudocercospora musae]
MKMAKVMAATFSHAMPADATLSFDPHARIAWLEQQNQILFNDGAKQYAEVQRLLIEKQQQPQQHVNANSTLSDTATVSQQIIGTWANEVANLTRRLDDQNRTIASQKTRIDQLVHEKNRLQSSVAGAIPSSQLDHVKSQLEKANRQVDEYRKLIVGHDQIVRAFEKKIADLEAAKAKSSNKRSRNMVSLDSDDEFLYPRKKIATKFCYDNKYGGESWTQVSDTEDDASGLRMIPKEVAKRMEEIWRHNIYQETRLEPGAFEWLEAWCEDNADRIELQRAKEREQNGAELRILAREKVDVEGEITKLKRRLVEQIKEKRGIRRKLIVLTDEQRLDASDGMDVGKKLFLFCKTMGYPQYDFRRAHFEFVRSETELVRIYHQVMSAMRVLYQDLVEEPKKADKKFKHRNPSPTKWQVLYLAQPDYGGRQRYPLEEQYASNAKDARMACTALQNLLYSWQQGVLS